MIMYNEKESMLSQNPVNKIKREEISDLNVKNHQILELANQLYRDNFLPASQNPKEVANSIGAGTNLLSDKTKLAGDVANNKNLSFDHMMPTSTMNDNQEAMGFYFLKDKMSHTLWKSHTPSDWEHNYVHTIRKDFPILHRKVNGKSLVWLDNGATTQKPNCVINALNQYYSQYNSNIHRGAHTLANQATQAYEGAREKVRSFLGAKQVEEIIFTRGTTEAINLVAESYGSVTIQKGDEILVSLMEHHSNIVPWQKLQQEIGAVIKVIPINDCGEIILEEYEKLFSMRTKFVAITHVSNVLGTINPVKTMVEIAHRHGARVLVDGAQSIPHLPVDVKDLDADFYVFSGHKMYGPTGIGILYGKLDLLERMPPWQRGGGMIDSVSFEHIGLGAAIDYLNQIGMNSIKDHETALTRYAMERLVEIPGLRLIGTAMNKTSVLSFLVNGMSPERVGQLLNQEGIAVRSGHHCAQPVLNRFGLTSTVRASLGVYNTKEEVNYMADALLKIAKYYN